MKMFEKIRKNVGKVIGVVIAGGLIFYCVGMFVALIAMYEYDGEDEPEGPPNGYWGVYFTYEPEGTSPWVDGEILRDDGWERVEQYIYLKNSIDAYYENKEEMGYTMENLEVYYISTNGEWSNIGIVSSGMGCYVRTDELVANMKFVDEMRVWELEEGILTEGAYDYFVNLKFELFKENNEIIYVPQIEGLTYLGRYEGYYDRMEEVEQILMDVRESGFCKYGISYIEVTEDYVVFEIYGAQ